MARLNDHETAGKFVRLFPDNLQYRSRERASCLARKPDENHASRGGVAGKHLPAEILVFGEENPGFPMSLLNHSGIKGLVGEFRDRDNIVTGTPQGTHDRKVTAFVGEKAERGHDLSGRLEEDGFVGQGIGGIRQRRLDVSVLQPWVRLQQVRFRCVLAQLAQDQLNRYPRSANDRLAQHDVRIDLDTLVFHANRVRRSLISHKPASSRKNRSRCQPLQRFQVILAGFAHDAHNSSSNLRFDPFTKR